MRARLKAVKSSFDNYHPAGQTEAFMAGVFRDEQSVDLSFASRSQRHEKPTFNIRFDVLYFLSSGGTGNVRRLK